jgi:hypothetical protein
MSFCPQVSNVVESHNKRNLVGAFSNLAPLTNGFYDEFSRMGSRLFGWTTPLVPAPQPTVVNFIVFAAQLSRFSLRQRWR